MGRSDYLFAPTSFLDGISRIFDFWGGLREFNSANTDTQADAIAMRQDWIVVGQDMRAAITAYRAKHPEAIPEKHPKLVPA